MSIKYIGPGDQDRGARRRLWLGQAGRMRDKGDHSDQPRSGDNDLEHPGRVGEQLRGCHGRSDWPGFARITVYGEIFAADLFSSPFVLIVAGGFRIERIQMFHIISF